MNYGFSDPDVSVPLKSHDEKNRYSIQLYRHLIDFVNLEEKDLVEIGSGRGGGLAYIAGNYPARSVLGVDLDRGAVAFSNRNYNHGNLAFQIGNAEQLPLMNDSCDIILNVESSHRYQRMDSFLNEVTRLLRNGGYFLFTDFRYDYEWPETDELFKRFRLKILNKKDITPNVVKALEMSDPLRRALIKKMVPKFMQKVMLNFAGAIGSETYNYFLNRNYIYKSYVFQKY